MKTTVAAFAAALVTITAWAASAPPSTNVAWLSAASDAEVDRAFTTARAQRKPVLLYWGATWCPPCNQLKATFFNRQEFAAQSKSFVAVHVDGDRPGAQKVGQRFKVSGYPTVVLFKPDGTEITRLPNEVEPERLLAVLQLGLSGGRAVKDVLADARARRPLGAGEWRLLAFYAWDSDEQRLLPKADVPALLAELAAASAVAASGADAETTTRLWLKAIAASDDGKGVKPDAALRDRVQRLLADAALARAHADLLAGYAADIVRTLSDDDAPERATLVAAFEPVLRRFEADATLSRADRLAALVSRVELARLPEPKKTVHPKLPEALRQEVREHSARVDREMTDAYERQAVIPYAAHALALAGLWDESDALLKGNLARSHSPYYLMSGLASNARKLGRTDEALRWYAQAWERSVGPATRLQWGAGYLTALVDLAPQEAARIERTAAQLFDEAAKDSGAYYDRSARYLQRIGGKLKDWNKDGSRGAALQRLQARLDGVCAKLGAADARRAECKAVLAKTAA